MQIKIKPIIYLAGPMAGCNWKQRRAWRTNAALALAHRYAFLSPVHRDYSSGNFTIEEIVQGDKRDVTDSHIVLANLFIPSVGTTMEILHGWNEAKRIVVVTPHTDHPWLRYHSHAIFNNIEQAIAFLDQEDPWKEHSKSALRIIK